jgi:hypothetical protein
LAYSVARAIKLGDGGVFPFVWLHRAQAGTTSARYDTWMTCRISVSPA